MYGWGAAVQAVTSSSFIISAYAVMSASSNGRSTNRSVLMEMSGNPEEPEEAVVMRRSITFMGLSLRESNVLKDLQAC
ncbi:hypothetical protein GCM10010252_46940 [Streptomyces aureoverticillatus]|nr:hypothetical protein GCM10010252_46940 [Streptomyces aureoverticillatus]